MQSTQPGNPTNDYAVNPLPKSLMNVDWKAKAKTDPYYVLAVNSYIKPYYDEYKRRQMFPTIEDVKTQTLLGMTKDEQRRSLFGLSLEEEIGLREKSQLNVLRAEQDYTTKRDNARQRYDLEMRRIDASGKVEAEKIKARNYLDKLWQTYQMQIEKEAREQGYDIESEKRAERRLLRKEERERDWGETERNLEMKLKEQRSKLNDVVLEAYKWLDENKGAKPQDMPAKYREALNAISKEESAHTKYKNKTDMSGIWVGEYGNAYDSPEEALKAFDADPDVIQAKKDGIITQRDIDLIKKRITALIKGK